MKQETITTTFIKLKADDGKVLCDGTAYGRQICLPSDADTSVWIEITEDEAIALIEKNNEEESTQE